MQIVLPGVVVPTPIENSPYIVSDQAKKYATYLAPTKVLSVDELLCLDRAINKLKSDGDLWQNKIKHLILPMVPYVNASTNALKLIKIDIRQSWDEMSRVDMPFATDTILTTYFKMANGGIERQSDALNYTATTQTFRFQTDLTLPSNDSSFLFYKKSGTVPYTDSNKKQYTMYAFSGSLKAPVIDQNLAGTARICLQENFANSNISFSQSATNALVGFSALGTNFYKVAGDNVLTVDVSAFSSYAFDNPTYWGTVVAGVSLGMGMEARGITPAQIQLVKEAMAILEEKF